VVQGGSAHIGAPVSHTPELYSSSFFVYHHFFLPSSPHPHRFIIIRHLDLRRKTTANESKTVPLSQPPVIYPSSDSLPSFQTLDNDDHLLPQRHDI
jgi:hypothetical protein